MVTAISFRKVISGYPRPTWPARFRETGRLEPAPGIGLKCARRMEPKELLRAFLSVNFDEAEEVAAYLLRNGVPTKCVGLDGYPEDYPAIIAFDELAALAGEAIPSDRLAELRSRFLSAIGYGTEFYTLDEVKELQGRFRELTELITAAIASKALPHDDQVDRVNYGVQEAQISVAFEPTTVKGRQIKTLRLEARSWSNFETCLHLGVLQLIVEGMAIRRCLHCGEYFEMGQRRPNRKFCNVVCKVAYFNAQRRRKHELAAERPYR